MSPKPEPMRPVRYENPDLWSIDPASVSLKDSQQQLEHPFFVLSTKPDTQERHYADDQGNSITITPSGLGMPTILDKDILIYAITHVMHRKNRGEPISRNVVVYSSDMLRFSNRWQSGRDYAALERAIKRLAGCVIQTNVRTGDTLETSIFSLLESAELQRRHDTHGRLMHCEITLSEWLWRAIQANEVLTLHSDYFRLRRPLDRRLYEIARKHCGRQPNWTISLERLRQKCAVKSPLYSFRSQIRQIGRRAAGDDSDHLPGYTIQYIQGRDQVCFRPRSDDTISLPKPDEIFTDTTWQAAKALAPGYDVRELNRLWIAWRAKKALPPPANPAAAFLGFIQGYMLRVRDALAEAAPEPAPDSEIIDPAALHWWKGLSDDVRHKLEDSMRAYTIGNDERQFRSDRQLIETCYRRHGPQRN